LDRRRFLAGSAASLSTLGMSANSAAAASPEEDRPFDATVVRAMARTLAQKPFKVPDKSMPGSLKDIDYDQYRSIRFKPDKALWRGEGLPFEVQFFHRGFIFEDRVDVYIVDKGEPHLFAYSPDLFTFGMVKPPPGDAHVGFAGFRLHAPINRPDYYDEVGVFLGASYFRAVARKQVYGLSARGLALRTADPKGEEFPFFKTYWIEKPAKGTDSIVVHALLDSESAAAAFRFTIRPGDTTIYDVQMALYPRVNIKEAGVAPLTSMFFFDANDRVGVDDYRPAVHDSEGLAMRNGRGEELWRPLINPQDLQISIFSDINPRGFGLMQRERKFHNYEDLEARFEKRPSLWIEPIGDWNAGAVHLVEIPTKKEIHDNIVPFWRPRDPLLAKREYIFTYRMHWGWDKANPRELARFTRTRIGAGPDGRRLFVLSIEGGGLDFTNVKAFRATVTADKGQIQYLVLQRNPVTGGLRVTFQLATNKEPVIELRGQLMQNDKPVSEVWMYRWTL
jgi:periplasmic glucans biosynthesis protein